MPSRARLRRRLADLALQSGLIVLSILLALAADRWVDARDRAERVQEAASSFSREIATNRERIERVLPYHRALRQAVVRADSLGTVHDLREWRREIPIFSGFRTPDVTRTAWETAVATGVLTDMDYALVADLSAAYTLQQKLDAFNDASLPAFDFSDAAMRATVRRSFVYLASVISFEEALLREYDRALRHLGRAR